MATGLAHIQEGELHPSVFQTFCNSFSIGPLKIEYCVDLSIPQISFSVYLLGVRIGGGTLNPQNPSLKIGGSVDGFKAEVTLTVDFNAKQVTYQIELCAPLVGCKDYQGTLFSWK